MSTLPTITLNNGVAMPQLGFGVWQVPDGEAEVAVGRALESGYRSIDTAAVYGNERGVGRAVTASDVPRDELFVTTKLWNSDHGQDNALRAFDASLDRLGLEYVDLYLIHWPLPMFDSFVDTWRAFERLHAEGRARAVGVSNFQPHHLQRLLDETTVVPAVNQIELHPSLQQEQARTFHSAHDIATEAWSPLGQGKAILDDPQIAAVAEKHGRTAAQVILRWHLQLGNVVIPKSVTPERIRANIDVFGFELDTTEMNALASLNTETRLGADPDKEDTR